MRDTEARADLDKLRQEWDSFQRSAQETMRTQSAYFDSRLALVQDEVRLLTKTVQGVDSALAKQGSLLRESIDTAAQDANAARVDASGLLEVVAELSGRMDRLGAFLDGMQTALRH